MEIRRKTHVRALRAFSECVAPLSTRIRNVKDSIQFRFVNEAGPNCPRRGKYFKCFLMRTAKEWGE
jgi:hypothetical protein